MKKKKEGRFILASSAGTVIMCFLRCVCVGGRGHSPRVFSESESFQGCASNPGNVLPSGPSWPKKNGHKGKIVSSFLPKFLPIPNIPSDPHTSLQFQPKHCWRSPGSSDSEKSALSRTKTDIFLRKRLDYYVITWKPKGGIYVITLSTTSLIRYIPFNYNSVLYNTL